MSKSATEDSDQKLLADIRYGKSDALEKLYEEHYPMVLNMILSNNGSEEEAQDVFQEAVIIVYDKIRDTDFELSSKLKTYIYAICRRLWLKQLNHQHRGFLDVTEYENNIPVEDDIEKHQLKDIQLGQMEEALAKLGEPCKTIIQDFYIKNMSMQDICEKFGYTNADNAKTQKYKCLQRLKKLFFTSN